VSILASKRWTEQISLTLVKRFPSEPKKEVTPRIFLDNVLQLGLMRVTLHTFPSR